MKLEAQTVVFKTSDRWYEAERSGIKPCTVRAMPAEDFHRLTDYDPTYIRIEHAVKPDTCFTRVVKYIDDVSGVLPERHGGMVLCVICWGLA